MNPRIPRNELREEYCITHHANSPDSGVWFSVVMPPEGKGWTVKEFAASGTATHILWSRTKPAEPQ